MKLEVSYRTGTTHEVEIPASVVVLGRDPGCDLVLNDLKCSRRHAILEDRPEGLVVRDSGSSNGVYLNGKRVEQAPLRVGDRLRLGDVQLRVLEEIAQTVVIAAFETDAEDDASTRPPGTLPKLLEPPPVAPRPAAPPAEPTPAPRPSAPPRLPDVARPSARPAASTPVQDRPRPGRRPTTVAVLALLWALAAPVLLALPLVVAERAGAAPLGWALAAALGLLLAAGAALMAFGLGSLSPWARNLQLAAAALGLLACPFTLASATVLLYLTRPEVKGAFEGAADSDSAAETTFALSLVGMLLLGLALSAVAVLFLRP
jgi:hypothetical protein